MSQPYDRPTDEPGGCECECCGVIFIGAEWHVLCAVCDAERIGSMNPPTPRFRGMPTAREWISSEKCGHGASDSGSGPEGEDAKRLSAKHRRAAAKPHRPKERVMPNPTPQSIVEKLSEAQRRRLLSFRSEPRQMGAGMQHFLPEMVEPAGPNHPVFGPHYSLTALGAAVVEYLEPTAMTDFVNDFFRSHYPPDYATAWETECVGSFSGRRYRGEHRETHDTVFPFMVLADGLKLSVQGHFGAYSHPRDDFAEKYASVEIMAPPNLPEFADLRADSITSEHAIYPYVPVEVVNQMIAGRGGLSLHPLPEGTE